MNMSNGIIEIQYGKFTMSYPQDFMDYKLPDLIYYVSIDYGKNTSVISHKKSSMSMKHLGTKYFTVKSSVTPYEMLVIVAYVLEKNAGAASDKNEIRKFAKVKNSNYRYLRFEEYLVTIKGGDNKLSQATYKIRENPFISIKDVEKISEDVHHDIFKENMVMLHNGAKHIKEHLEKIRRVSQLEELIVIVSNIDFDLLGIENGSSSKKIEKSIMMILRKEKTSGKYDPQVVESFMSQPFIERLRDIIDLRMLEV
jgi:hypothetical protein